MIDPKLARDENTITPPYTFFAVAGPERAREVMLVRLGGRGRGGERYMPNADATPTAAVAQMAAAVVSPDTVPFWLMMTAALPSDEASSG